MKISVVSWFAAECEVICKGHFVQPLVRAMASFHQTTGDWPSSDCWRHLSHNPTVGWLCLERFFVGVCWVTGIPFDAQGRYSFQDCHHRLRSKKPLSLNTPSMTLCFNVGDSQVTLNGELNPVCLSVQISTDFTQFEITNFEVHSSWLEPHAIADQTRCKKFGGRARAWTSAPENPGRSILGHYGIRWQQNLVNSFIYVRVSHLATVEWSSPWCKPIIQKEQGDLYLLCPGDKEEAHLRWWDASESTVELHAGGEVLRAGVFTRWELFCFTVSPIVRHQCFGWLVCVCCLERFLLVFVGWLVFPFLSIW